MYRTDTAAMNSFSRNNYNTPYDTVPVGLYINEAEYSAARLVYFIETDISYKGE